MTKYFIFLLWYRMDFFFHKTHLLYAKFTSIISQWVSQWISQFNYMILLHKVVYIDLCIFSPLSSWNNSSWRSKNIYYLLKNIFITLKVNEKKEKKTTFFYIVFLQIKFNKTQTWKNQNLTLSFFTEYF